MKKKLFTAVILTVAALTLVVASVLGTIAYLTANSAVSNVFTVGDVKIEMFEHKVNSDGQIDKSAPLVETDTNSYHLVPGKTYDKNPTIRITSKLEQDEMYLFVKSSNQIRSIEAGNSKIAGDVTGKTMREQMEANGWVEFVRSENGVEIVWVYGTRVVESGVITPTPVGPETVQGTEGEKGLFKLFDTFTISNKADVSLYGAAKVSFTAFAIQDSGFSGETATKDAWEALKSVYPYEGGIINPVNPYNNSKDNPYDPVAGVAGPVDIEDSSSGTVNP